ncbi:Alpha/Beta hydrolase protein [Naematelia encephala]|uniref:Alpha/Beta hydrolase protein n=1 Tax=Naematelia encephala TaxID=71784 RepID=A0A1Y2B565_9TREE|nr:Alpha/Beta hydrolase protein [Naematelia encephala]
MASTPRSSLREQIAAKRAEARKAATRAPASSSKPRDTAQVSRSSAPVEALEDVSIDGQIKKAIQTGKLDLSSLPLPNHRLPPQLYTALLNIPASELSSPPPPPPPPSSSKPTLSSMTRSISDHLNLTADQVFNIARESVWVEPEELVSFKANDCGVEDVDKEFGEFGGLTRVELSGNSLSSLGDGWADLLKLTFLDLSKNKLTAIPPSILLLPVLQVLDLSHNAITTLDFSAPTAPSDQGLAYGIGFLSTSFSRALGRDSRTILPALRSLNLSGNRLTNTDLTGLATTQWPSLRVLNLGSNALEGQLDVEKCGMDKKHMPDLMQLILSDNPRLMNVEGDLATGVKVELEGCGKLDAPRKTFEAVSASTSDEQPGQTNAAASGPSLLIPNPTMTFVYRNLPAATFDSEPLNIDLDIYLPSTAAGPSGHPLVVWFHGGGLLQGNKENLPPHFRRLPSHVFPNGESIAVISPNYRLAPQVPILDVLSDITALMAYIRTKLNARLEQDGQGDHKIDVNRICLSGGSAGGYLALIAGLEVPKEASEEDVGGYRGGENIKCIAPIYPITDLTDEFWATEVNPAPWMSRSITHAEAKPHIDTKAAPVYTSASDGPRSVVYPYMLQHGLYPSLLFLSQRPVGRGLDAFRPQPLQLSIPYRLDLLANSRNKKSHVPIYFTYCEADTAVQRMEKTLAALRRNDGELVVDRIEGGAYHGYDEAPEIECLELREWLGRTLL